MKNIIKTILAIALMSGFSSCTDEQNLMFLTPEASFQILSPVTGEGVILSPTTPLNPALALTWSAADYGTPTEVTYLVQVDKAGNNFASPIDVTSTTKTYATVASSALNGAAIAAGLLPFTEGGLDVRIVATVGTTASGTTYSTVISYLVTPYTTDLPQLAVPGNHQGWSPNTAPRIAASAFGKTDYEGYVWLDGGYKLVGPTAAGVYAWSAGPEYGDDGTFSGVLKSPGGGNCDAATGYYLLKADTDKLTYSATKTTWAIIGNGTAGGWSTDTPMTYDAASKTWTVTATLSTQAAPDNGLKFRANGAWDLNFGDTGADGTLEGGGTNISTTAGTYLITLDLSKPRNYTYTMVKQ
ncbi:MAG: SusE domain-containing protein [Flavobacterium sp.]|uniref:SusE domain-containing protein n=1 Tax=Flavobacterium sp. TaxID=239 RepID=UPI00262E41CD|nr:SusE domain-containing protein [Flavobacterium sp.]MDD5149935.1 SusE domain-containing protein [Flavobacterium sp.]